MAGAPSGLNDFEVVGSIGEGAYSTVFKVSRRSDRRIYALKKVLLPNLTDKEKRNALNEVRLLASVRHDNVVAYKESFFDEPSQCLCIITEYADGQDLFAKIQRHQNSRQYIPEPEIWHVVLGLAQGLRALHGMKILHRDLKSANVFMTCRGDVKLGDFNVSKVAKRGLLHTQTGTPYYASPEVWKDMPYDAKSDLWSLGCVAYEMAALKPPFRADDMEGLYKKVLQGRYPRIPGCYSQDLSQLIMQLLQVNPKQRPSIAQLLQSPLMLRHAARAPSPAGSPRGGLLNTIQLPRGQLTSLFKTDLPLPQYGEGDQAAGAGSVLSEMDEYEEDWEDEKPRSSRRSEKSERREEPKPRREEWREEQKPRRGREERREAERRREGERRPSLPEEPATPDRWRSGEEKPLYEERRRHASEAPSSRSRRRDMDPHGAYAAPSLGRQARRRANHRSYPEERERERRERRERQQRSKSVGSSAPRSVAGKLRLPSIGLRAVRQQPGRAKLRLPPLAEAAMGPQFR